MLARLMSKLMIDGEILLDRVEAIIFDKDGTLIDVHHYWSSMIKIRATKIVDKWFNSSNYENVRVGLVDVMGVDYETNKLKPNGPVGVKSRSYIVNVVKNYIKNNGVSVDSDEIELLFKEVDIITAENLSPLIRVLSGTKELINKMSQLGIKSVITSTDITSRAIKAMEVLGLQHHFSEIIGGDLVQKTKPAPEMVNLALSKIHCQPENVAVIGDHPVDIEMGLSANVGLNIGVLTGLSDEDLFSDLNCIVIKDLSSISIGR
jgi:phosphoglycolate phosphatase